MASRLILLHSPLLGPLTWKGVADEFARRSRPAVAPSWPHLDAVGDEPYAALADAMAATIDGAGAEGAILVAHSGAGALIPALEARLKAEIVGVVFCDAILPHPGSSWFDTAPQDLAMQLRAGGTEGRLPSWDNWWPPGALERLVPDAGLRQTMQAELQPIPIDYFEATAPDQELRAPGAYLRLSGAYEDEARLAGRYGWPVVSLPLHHLAMLTHPDAIAVALEGLAARLEATHG